MPPRSPIVPPRRWLESFDEAVVKANLAMGMGAMQGVTYIQRVATQGGVAPAMPCDGSKAGMKQIVNYQADYILWKAA